MSNELMVKHMYNINLRIEGVCMNIFLWAIVCLICFIIIKSLLDFINGGNNYFKMRLKESRFSRELFYTLLILYSIVITGFALIYFILSFQGIVLVEHGELQQANIVGSLIHSFYFSGVTLLTIGYGDIIPMGIGRFIALIEALLGYVLPTAFVLRLVQTRQTGRND